MHKAITFQRAADLPPVPGSLGTMLWNKTGTWRYVRPVFENHTPPCDNRCPAGEPVQGYLALAKEGRFAEAWQLLVQVNPFPGVCGRVCDHPCESVCNRASLDEPLAVHLVERFLSDFATAHGLTPAPPDVERRPERIAVIGGGPAGLSCAYHLSRLGYRVTVFEAAAEPGGMLRQGIPRYRLPREVLEREIATIVALGVEIKTGMRAGRDFGLADLGGYAAVFVATGAHEERRLGIPGEELPGVLAGLAFLRAANAGDRSTPGRRVAVIGGGNTAIDVARVALRLGAEATLLYRRRREDMPAIAAEVAAAEAEGVAVRCLTLPERIVATPDGLALSCLAARAGELDESGRPRPVPIAGSGFTLAVDRVIKAIGEDASLTFLGAERDQVIVGGDAAAPAQRRRVAEAIGAGKRAALAIAARLRNAQPEPPSRPSVVSADKMNFDYFLPAARASAPVLEWPERRSGFAEVNGGIGGDAALAEAGRCLSCGVCTRCDVCWTFCPDIAIARRADGAGYTIDYDYCKGCGICVAECPRAAMATYEEKLEPAGGGSAR